MAARKRWGWGLGLLWVNGVPGPSSLAPTDPRAPCSCVVQTWAQKGPPFHDFGVYVNEPRLSFSAANKYALISPLQEDITNTMAQTP